MKPGKLIFLAIVGLVLYGSMFTVDMKQHAIVLELGAFEKTISEPGLYFKKPLIQDVTYFPKQLLVSDAEPAELITLDKKNLQIDNYSMWRIVDPLKFLKTVRTINSAASRLDDIINSELRVELSNHDLIDVVTKTREEIMEKVAKESAQKVTEMGIEVIDVRIKRADLPGKIADSVFDRMRTERQRIAREYRSEGNEEATKIRATTDKEKVILLAQAYKEEQKIRGEGDGRATKIYADAFNQDPEFYSFIRSMQAYKNSFKSDTTILLSEKSDFLEFLNKDH
ncbi:MAG: protease modulator HflC [Candidatus Nitronauta litoralis]|uniref:Protein HflC n=1 Tax=Candidatus Nitronauta litoralis TaxID=2705533 RepID=A0A7T0BW19_9BACT|nr:MAG: protease modulator HflC [Candidatus Nitronauta litoralis]